MAIQKIRILGRFGARIFKRYARPGYRYQDGV